MKKIFLLLVSIFAALICASTVLAGPEEVTILPVTKWNYHNVDGWGLYPQGADYSWFAFVLDNPTSEDYTISFPTNVNVAARSSHSIVNLCSKKMDRKTTHFLREDRPKIYFRDEVILPKKSTYAFFMDVTGISYYTQQWDTDVFFEINVRGKDQSASISISGKLARDVYEKLPFELTIIDPDIPSFSAFGFCRNYDTAARKVSLAYTLRNNTSVSIPVELAKTIAAEGLSSTAAVTYTKCISDGDSCISRISDGIYHLRSGETAVFYGEAVLGKKPAESDFYIRTSLRYNFNGDELIPYSLGSASSGCSASGSAAAPTTEVTAVPSNTAAPTKTAVPTNTAVPTKTAVPTQTIAPAKTQTVSAAQPSAQDEPLTSVSFCREYDASKKKVSFVYVLRNNTAVPIQVELAKTIAADGQNSSAAIAYTQCLSSGKACTSRIRNGIFTLEAGETAEFHGEAVLKAVPPKDDFAIKTSLRYNYNGNTLIPFYVGSAAGSCSAAVSAETPTAVPTEPAAAVTVPVQTEAPVLTTISFCRDYNTASKKITFFYSLKNNTSGPILLELAKTIAVEGQKSTAAVSYTQCLCNGKNCTDRLQNGRFTLKTGETAEFYGEAVPGTAPSKSDFYIRTSLRYDHNGSTLIPFYVGSAADSCSTAVKSADTAREGCISVPFILSNDSDLAAEVTPGTVYLHNASIREYAGTAMLTSRSKAPEDVSEVSFSESSSFILPAHSTAEIELILDSDAFTSGNGQKTITWNYSIGNTVRNLTAEVNTDPVRTSTDRDLQLYRINEPGIPEKLPATGFSTQRPVPLSIQPEALAYRSLSGLALEIPRIDVTAELVEIPLNDRGEWAAEWLGDRAGVPENSPLPGHGTVMIAAHNHLNEMNAGPFLALKALEIQDRIFITDDRGQVQTYRVYANELASPDDAEAVYSRAIPGSLILMTCEQELPEGGYAWRRLIYAEPMQ